MRKIKIGLGGALVVLAVGLLCALPAPVTAQTTEPPETGVTDPPPAETPAGDDTGTETPSTAHPPGYIGELMKSTDLKQDQVDQMRTTGYGWGEIRLATRLAQQIAANSDGTLTFADALTQVMEARTAGKGFGQIAADNNLKIGKLVGNRKAAGEGQKGSAAQQGNRVRATEVEGDEEVSPDPANPPAYIREMVQAQVVTQEQVNTMLAGGYGWGEVRIATLLSQKIAANSNGALTFADALKQVMDARAGGKDFGQIAADNNLKVGELVRHQKAGDATTAKGKKPGFFARVGRALGFGRSADKAAKPATVDKPQASAKAVQSDKPERPARPERAVKAERPERPERPAHPDRPERPERPSRPERPERGPR
jgi:hypothetical protein